VLAELGIAPEDGTLILTREIASGGRGMARINGRAVPVAALQRVAAALVDIHGQSAHLTLLRPEEHVYLLDRFAGCVAQREEVAALVKQWRGVRRDLDALLRDDRELERRAELLRFQADEIAAARLQPGEDATLERERLLLANAERLRELTATAHGILAGDDAGDTPGALDQLAGARRALDELVRLDPALGEQMAAFDDALFRLEDVAAGVRSYEEDLAADPARLAEVEERLDLLARLRRKYGATTEEIVAYGDSAATELDQLTHREERAAALHDDERRLRERIGERATALSHARQRAAANLAAAMERELDELHMKRAGFRVAFQHTPDDAGVPARPGEGAVVSGEAQRYAFGPTGIDRVEFLIAPNQGEPFKPLARIASGGETSRLMLALKSILSAADEVPILIFDEVDAGISGRAGQVVGEKLWRLARHHQVICVTHLPQIAALGDTHFRVAKVLTGDRTATQVEPLAGAERASELAQLLGGSATRASHANANELLKQGARWKEEQLAASGMESGTASEA
jgi:DNA repair protein RecN (Recombination protein N)